jgi:stage V sporulation protein SpoVS
MITAPYVSNDGYVAEMPVHEFWIRSEDNVPRTVDELLASFHTMHMDIACIGAAAVNQAIKVLAAARQKLEVDNIDIVIQPYFSNILDEHNRKRTRMMLRATMQPLKR